MNWIGSNTRFVALATLICSGFAGFTPPQACAGVWVQVGATALDVRETTGDTETGGTRGIISTTVAYRFSQGFVLGLQGFSSRLNSPDSSTWAFGPKGGLFIKGVEFTAAYLPFAAQSQGGKTRSGGGVAVNLGYNFELSRVLHLGIYGTYWSNTYSEDDTTLFNPRPVVRHIAPMLSLGFHF